MLLLWITVGLVGFYAFILGSYILTMFIYAKKKMNLNINNSFKPKISIVTATHNERATIEKKIKNMLEIDYPHNLIEWVIIDDISTDGTREIINKFLEVSPFRIKFIKRDQRFGLSNSLNLGYEVSNGEIVIKSDCDILMEKDTVAKLVQFMSDNKIGAVSATAKLKNTSNVERGYKDLFTIFRLGESNLDSTYVFQPVSAFRKRLIKKIDENSLADDAELALKIRRQGYRTIYHPEAVFYEEIPNNFKERRKIKDRRALGHVRLVIKYIDMLFNRKYGKFGMYIYPMNFYLLYISPYLLITCYILIAVSITYFSLVGSMVFLIGSLIIIIGSYFIKPLNFIAAFIDSNLSIISATIKAITTRNIKPTWDIQRNVTSEI